MQQSGGLYLVSGIALVLLVALAGCIGMIYLWSNLRFKDEFVFLALGGVLGALFILAFWLTGIAIVLIQGNINVGTAIILVIVYSIIPLNFVSSIIGVMVMTPIAFIGLYVAFVARSSRLDRDHLMSEWRLSRAHLAGPSGGSMDNEGRPKQ